MSKYHTTMSTGVTISSFVTLSLSVVMKRDTRRAIGIWAQRNGFIHGAATERGEDGCMQSLLSKVTTD